MKLSPASVAIGIMMQFFLLRSSAAFSPMNLARRSLSSKSFEQGRTKFLFQKESPSLSSSLASKTKLSMAAATDEELEPFINKNNLDDQIFSCISGNGEIKVTACTIRNLVNDVMIQQSLTATPADALARSMVCSLLLSNGMQAEQTFQLTMACDGPIRSVVAIADGVGQVRGFVGNPSLGEMHISEAIGKGTVQIVKMHPDWPTPYNGVTAIEHGDVDRDVGIYLANSEQRACALAASTQINGILCTAAGGYIVEQLPGCSPETSAQVEQNLANLAEKDGTNTLPAGILLNGGSPLDICGTVLEKLDMKPLQQIAPRLTCDCSEERLFRAVRLLPKEDVEKILANEEQIEARCDFCAKEYRMSPDDVRERFATASGDPALDDDFKE
jgi:molecular chaperone Hsp33